MDGSLTYRMSRITQQTNHVLIDVRTPGLDILADSEMRKDLLVKLRVRRQQLLDGAVLDTPSLVHVVALLSREEAV
ncbi:salicylate hydroxylase, partial [Colletotrichum scovillei]